MLRNNTRRLGRLFKAFTIAALVPASLLAATPAVAKKICVEDDFGYAWVFPQANLPKVTGRVKALSGYTRSAIGQIATIDGTAVKLSSGDWAVGLEVHRWGIDSVLGTSFQGTLDKDLEGVMIHANTFPIELDTLSSIDCATVPAP